MYFVCAYHTLAFVQINHARSCLVFICWYPQAEDPSVVTAEDDELTLDGTCFVKV